MRQRKWICSTSKPFIGLRLDWDGHVFACMRYMHYRSSKCDCWPINLMSMGRSREAKRVEGHSLVTEHKTPIDCYLMQIMHIRLLALVGAQVNLNVLGATTNWHYLPWIQFVSMLNCLNGTTGRCFGGMLSFQCAFSASAPQPVDRRLEARHSLTRIGLSKCILREAWWHGGLFLIYRLCDSWHHFQVWHVLQYDAIVPWYSLSLLTPYACKKMMAHTIAAMRLPNGKVIWL